MLLFPHLPPPPAPLVLSDNGRRMAALWQEALCPPDGRSIPDWAEGTLRFTPSQSPLFAGQPWSITNAPHVRLIFDFLQDDDARELHLEKSSAAQFSTTLVVGIIWMLRYRPCRVLYTLQNDVEAGRFGNSIIRPFLRQVFDPALIDHPKQSSTFYQFPNGSLLQIGSPTEAFFSNKQATIVVLDEYDTYPDVLAGGNTHPLEGARGRVKAAKNAGKIITLTAPQKAFKPEHKDLFQPGTKQDAAWQDGDRREYRCPCPKCGHEFVWDRTVLRYDQCLVVVPQPQLPLGSAEAPLDLPTRTEYDPARLAVETEIRCPLCAYGIREGEEKIAAVRAGRWVPTVLRVRSRIWSARYMDTYALIGNSELGTIAAELIAAESKSQTDLASVLRSRFGLPDAGETGEDLTVNHIKRLCGAYDRGTCPVYPWFIALLIDCQKGPTEQNPLLFKWQKIAFLVSGTSYTVDYGQTISPQELRTVYEAPVTYAGPTTDKIAQGARLYCSKAAIDSGYRARGPSTGTDDTLEHHIYPLCASWGEVPGTGHWVLTPKGHGYTGDWRLIPLKGQNRAGMTRADVITFSDAITVGATHSRVVLPLVLFWDNHFKRHLYHGLFLPAQDAPKAGTDAPAADPASTAAPSSASSAPSCSNSAPSLAPRHFFPRPTEELDDEFLAENAAERYGLTTRFNRAARRQYQVEDWHVPKGLKNDWGDTTKMGRVLLALMQRPASAAHAA